MPANISAIEDSASVFYRGRAFFSAMADNIRMSDEPWRKRLADAVEASGRSKRSVSLDAGAGAGYVHSILSEGKDPTIEKLLDVCRVIGASPSFILYGVDIMPEDAEIIRAMRADPLTRDAVISLLRARKAS